MAGLFLAVGLVWSAPALGISAPIHIAKTGGDGVTMRTGPGSSNPKVGWIPEGVSPDYNCYSWGERINGVPIWFNVNWNGATGFYASYYDDSSYSSDAELQSKYRIPMCGSQPAPGLEYNVFQADGGVYYRNSPRWNDTSQTPGVGVYNGDRVRLICGMRGGAVGPYGNTWWSYVTNLSRNVGNGWVNHHNINDGQPSSQPPPGEPTCDPSTPGATTPAPVPAPVTVPATPKPLPAANAQVLVPDPAVWCVNYDMPARFTAKVRELGPLGFKVYFNGLEGTPHQNDWKCRYIVQDVRSPGYVLPATKKTYPIDFRAACSTQFPGSRLQQDLGPAWRSNWPWYCVAPAGRYYPPPQIRLRTVAQNRGFVARGLSANAAGRVRLDLTTPPPKGRSAVASARVVLGTGSRSVTKVQLTQQGRRLLASGGRRRVTFTLRVMPRNGRTVKTSTTVMLRR